jgi:hypothetical protein
MILVNGCSFSAPSYDNDSWVSGFYDRGFNKFKMNISNKIMQYNVVKNIAAGGSSNSIIRRKLFWYLNNALCVQKPNYIIIQWSTIDRWDYPIFVNNDRVNGFTRVEDYPERVNKINYMCNGTDTMGYAKDFYEKYYSLYGAVLDTLENIYHTQQYLKDTNIPYKMITIGNLFDMDVSIKKLIELQTTNVPFQKGNYANLKTNKSIFEKLEDYEDSWHELNIIKELLEKIDFSKFLFTDNINIDGFGGGIIEWFLNKNETLTGGDHHPSAEQHIRFFNEFLWPNIKQDIIQYKEKVNGIAE